MRIQVFEPFSKGLQRMRDNLFRNFDLKKWLTVGFTAFLAQLADFGGFGSGFNLDNKSLSKSERGWWDVWEFPGEAWHWLLENAIWFFLGAIILIIMIGLILLFLWLSSRGKFMFLYNVVGDKAEIGSPWNRFRSLGNSLFIFRIILFFISMFLVLIGIVAGFIILYSLYNSGGTDSTFWLTLVIGILLFLALMIVYIWVYMLVEDFMVPIMYKFNLRAFGAARHLIKLISEHLGSFILYTLLKFALAIAVFFAVMIIGFFTCCIGFIILAIPYVNSVILLPVFYTFRSFSVEFLEQFGDEYKLFPVEISEPEGSNF